MNKSRGYRRIGGWLLAGLIATALAPQYAFGQDALVRDFSKPANDVVPMQSLPSPKDSVTLDYRMAFDDAAVRDAGIVSPQLADALFASADTVAEPGQAVAAVDQPPSASDPKKLGHEPEDFSHQFLRQESVLLKPGDWKLDVGLNYTVFNHSYTNLATDGQAIIPLDSRVTRRLLLVPLDYRYGLCENLQAFVDVPFGWSNSENSYPGYDEFVNTGGIGDVTAGVSWLIHKSSGVSCSPDVIVTFGVTAPTANVSPLQGILDPPNTMLGQGFWFGSWNVLFVHTIDPIILFYGVGSRHAATRVYDGYSILYGDQYTYRGGIGFAVNERATLSAVLTGSYITNPSLNGTPIAGLDLEPISMRFAATIVRAHCDRIWEPFVEIGMTDDAPNARVGMTFTY